MPQSGTKMCKGLTKSGRPCLRKGEYCFQHQPKTSVPEPKFIPGEECCVCLEENIIQKTYCGHSVCNQCIKRLNENLCPICRRDLSVIPEPSEEVFDMRELFYALDDNYYYIEIDGESFILQIE